MRSMKKKSRGKTATKKRSMKKKTDPPKEKSKRSPKEKKRKESPSVEPYKTHKMGVGSKILDSGKIVGDRKIGARYTCCRCGSEFRVDGKKVYGGKCYPDEEFMAGVQERLNMLSMEKKPSTLPDDADWQRKKFRVVEADEKLPWNVGTELELSSQDGSIWGVNHEGKRYDFFEEEIEEI